MATWEDYNIDRKRSKSWLTVLPYVYYCQSCNNYWATDTDLRHIQGIQCPEHKQYNCAAGLWAYWGDNGESDWRIGDLRVFGDPFDIWVAEVRDAARKKLKKGDRS